MSCFDPRAERVRFSNLRNMARSPAHYYAALTHGIEETRAMRVGYAAHARTLGGNGYVVFPGDRRGKAWDAFKLEHDGARILTIAEHEDAVRVSAAVMANPLAKELLSHPELKTEHRIEWEFAGRACASHLDGLVPKQHVIELKVTHDAEPEHFGKFAARMMYTAQVAFYCAAAGNLDAAYIIAVEAKRPWPVTVLKLTPRTIDLGLRRCRLLMERLIACEAADEWPGYAQTVIDLDVPDEDGFELDFGAEEEAA